MRRSLALLAVAAALLVVAKSAGQAPAPALRTAAEVPADVAALAEATWARFLDAAPARRSCLEDVILETDRELAERGRYEPARQVVILRIPHTAPRLERTLVHEFAHHLEFSCTEHEDLRCAFLAAHGHAPGTPWFDESLASAPPTARWASIPSEQWAETVVELVLGPGSATPTVVIHPEAAALVDHWLRRGSLEEQGHHAPKC